MNWYDNISNTVIESDLKFNKVPYGLCAPLRRELFKSIPLEDLVGYDGGYDFICTWGLVRSLTETATYRLRPDWQRPKKGAGHWIYRKIENDHGVWSYKDEYDQKYYLDSAVAMVGFGGIEFKEWPTRWLMKMALVLPGIKDYPCFDSQQGDNSLTAIRPATPNRVRFWVEGER